MSLTEDRPDTVSRTKSISLIQRTAQIMFLLKPEPSTEEKIHISVNGASSHTWNQYISAHDWQSMVPNIESSIDSAFRNEAFEVTIKYLKAEKNLGEEKKAFSREKVDLTEVFGAVVPKAA